MYLYSITFCVDENIHKEWLQDIKSVYMPSLLLCGLINDYKILKMMQEQQEGAMTYNCQFFLNDLSDLHLFEQKHEIDFLLDIEKKYAGRFVPFITHLEVLNEN